MSSSQSQVNLLSRSLSALKPFPALDWFCHDHLNPGVRLSQVQVLRNSFAIPAFVIIPLSFLILSKKRISVKHSVFHKVSDISEHIRILASLSIQQAGLKIWNCMAVEFLLSVIQSSVCH